VIPALAELQMALLFGGRSGEREVSLASAAAVREALAAGGYRLRDIDTGEPRWWQQLEGVQLALNMQHGGGGENGETQGLLAALGIPCTGSGVLGSALAMDKIRSKQLWLARGLPTAEFAVVDAQFDGAAALAEWGALFIKPAREGSSLGMSRVDSEETLEAALAGARRHDSAVLAERLISGPEYTVGILGDRALPAIRIEAGGVFYDYDAKYRSGTTRYHIPCGLDAAELAEVEALSLAAFRALDCAVWGRVDLMRDTDGRFLLLEVNTVPGMTGHSLVPKAAAAAGISMTALLEEILGLSLAQAGGGA
jgi:D-alanine-D-alanine ligase